MAQSIAAKPVSVACATNAQSWSDFVAGANVAWPPGVPHDAGQVLGLTNQQGGDSIHLSPTVCAPLSWKHPNYRNVVAMHMLGAAAKVLVHEAEIARGLPDGGVVECAALAVMPKTLRSYFLPARIVTGPTRTKAQRAALAKRNKTARVAALRLMVEGAYLNHQAAVESSSFYRGACDG